MRSVFLALVLVPGLLSAQVGRGFTTVEAYVGAARIVHVGKILRLEPTTYEIPHDSPARYGKPYRMVFAVTETIRGPQAKELEIVLSSQHSHLLELMRDEKYEIMLVGGPNPLDDYPRPEPGLAEAGKPTLGQWYQFRVLDSKPATRGRNEALQDQLHRYYDEGRMFTVGLDVVRGRSQILARARAFARKYSQVLEATSLMVPNALGALVGSPNAFCLIRLPVCPEAERTIHEVLKNPNVILNRIKVKAGEVDRNVQIERALRALEPFRSKENEALVARLANGFNPATRYEDTKYGSADWVRHAAANLLQKWREIGKEPAKERGR